MVDMDMERSNNPVVILGLAFRRVRSLAPAASSSEGPTPSVWSEGSKHKRPLVDIEDVRKSVRKALGIKNTVSLLPDLPSCSPALVSSHCPSSCPVSPSASQSFSPTSEEQPQVRTYSSSTSTLPSHDAASGVSVFDIGTVGPSLLNFDEGKASPAAEQTNVEYSWFVSPPAFDAEVAGQQPLLDIDDVREFLKRTGKFWGKVQRLGFPETSWENKMPWHSPPPPFLAKGLQWPPERFASEEEKRRIYRKARERRPFLLGAPPTWSFMVANIGFIAFLVYNPSAQFLIV